MQVVAAELAAVGLAVHARGWKDPLPGPLAAGVRVLAAEGFGQGDPASLLGEVVGVLQVDLLQVVPVRRTAFFRA